MHRFATTSTALVLGLLLPTGAFAQQQVGDSGRALDANQRVGSGGINPTSTPMDFSSRNLLITGQVTGGRQFRGTTGIAAEGAFRGELGSDDLFRFRADSANVGGVGAGGAGPDSRFGGNTAGSALGGQSIIFNNYFSPATGRTGVEPARRVVAPDGVGTTRVGPQTGLYNPGLIGGPGSVADDGLRSTRRTLNGDTLGRFEDGEGRRLQLDASPLYGVSRAEVDAAAGVPGAGGRAGADGADAPGGTGPDLRRTGTDAPSAAVGAGARDLGVAGRAGEGLIGSDGRRSAPVQARNGAALGGEGAGPTDATLPREQEARLPGSPAPDATPGSGADAEPDAGSRGFARGGVPLAVQLGAQLNPVLREAGGAGGSSAAAGPDRDRMQRLREQIFRPLEQQEAQGDGGEAAADDPYLDLLRRIRSGEAGERAPEAPRPAWMRDLPGVPDDVLNSVEDRRQRSVQDLLRGLRSGDGDGSEPAAEDGAEAEAASDEARSVANQLGFDGPRLETLRSNRKTRINESLEQAETALAEGRYFDSEALYRQVVLDTEDDQPLPRVGLVHAQMAAGMSRSAALSLRSLFNDHPELISARYAEKLLPPADRVAWLRDDLQRQIDDPQASKAEPALMLAYLGRQVESRQLVRYGLALAEEARPADPLFSLLRVAWLGDEDAAEPGEPAE